MTAELDLGVGVGVGVLGSHHEELHVVHAGAFETVWGGGGRG